MPEPIRVPQLTVRAMVDNAPDPYGQPGCSGIWAYTETADSALLDQLSAAGQTSASVTLKCAVLEVDGTIGRFTQDGNQTRVAVEVRGIRIVPPTPPTRRGLSRRDP